MGGVLFVFVGQDYFPQIEAGSMTLHVRGRSGLRIEETERLFQQVEDTIRQQVPSVALILDNIGLPSNNYNLAFTDGSTVALNDGQILVSLKDGHPSSAGIMRRLRVVLRDRFPNAIFYFQPSDIITQVLDFGLPSPIDVQVSARTGRRICRSRRRWCGGCAAWRGRSTCTCSRSSTRRSSSSMWTASAPPSSA